MAQLLIVDDERSICELLEISFRKQGHKVEVATSGEAAKRRLASQMFDIVVSDICMPDMDGVELLRYCKEVSPATTFILVTGVPTIDTAIDAVNFGADRYVVKGRSPASTSSARPFSSVSTRLALKKEAGYLRRELRRLTGLDHIIGTSPKMRAIFDLIENIAPQNSRVLITGESGTGKELVARAIHENSARAKNPFITINCGAFPETLLESELFGYMKGAFTGANENRRGLFQAAHGGTLFMDEIGNMSVTMQVKLYRVLQEGKVRPIGSTEESDVDVRVIAATNKDLEKEIAEGRFREDLFYRLSVIPDSPAAAARTPRRHPASCRANSSGDSRSPWARRLKASSLKRCAAWKSTIGPETSANSRTPSSAPSPWKGATASPSSRCRTASAAIFRRLCPRFHITETAAMGSACPRCRKVASIWRPTSRGLERSYLLAALERCGGVRTHAADLLKMSYRSFRHYAKKYGV